MRYILIIILQISCVSNKEQIMKNEELVEIKASQVFKWQIKENIKITNNTTQKESKLQSQAKIDYDLAQSALFAQDTKKGVKLLQKILKEHPYYAPAYLSLARFYYFNGLYDKAQFIIFKALNLKIEDYNFYNTMAMIFIELNKIKSAKVYLKKSFISKPSNLDHMIIRARINLADGDLGEAYYILEKSLVDNKNNSLLYQYLGDLYHYKSQYKQAINYYLKSIDVSYFNQNSRFQLAVLYSYNYQTILESKRMFREVLDSVGASSVLYTRSLNYYKKL